MSWPPPLERCNETELYQLCRQMDLSVSPAATKVELISYILGEAEPPASNPIDDWRTGITGFVFEYWMRLQPQLTCPIRSKDPQSCWGCLDAQTIACVVQNPSNERLIKLHRKKG